MTLHLVFGVDPGVSGAIAVVADGEPAGFIDMPTETRQSGNGQIVDGHQLGALLRGVMIQHRGAHVFAAIERVQAMPDKLKGVRQGSSSVFNFGQADGIARGVIRCLGIPLVSVEPSQWKRRYNLIGVEKHFSRSYVIGRFPHLAGQLGRVKDHGRSDALLVALYALETERFSEVA